MFDSLLATGRFEVSLKGWQNYLPTHSKATLGFMTQSLLEKKNRYLPKQLKDTCSALTLSPHAKDHSFAGSLRGFLAEGQAVHKGISSKGPPVATFMASQISCSRSQVQFSVGGNPVSSPSLHVWTCSGTSPFYLKSLPFFESVTEVYTRGNCGKIKNLLQSEPLVFGDLVNVLVGVLWR